MFAVTLLACLFFQEYSAPEGPDGLVYKQGWDRSRFATKRKGKWDTWKVTANPGNGGAPVTLTPAERATVEAQLKRLAGIIESTPFAQDQIGWHARRSAAWIRTRFAMPGFPVAKVPVQHFYALYPFNLMDKKVTVNGVDQWVPDWSQETTAIYYEINGSVPGPRGAQILQKPVDEGEDLRWYAGTDPDATFHGFPVYDGIVVVGRKGRNLFRPVSVRQALSEFIPLHRKDKDSAEERLRGLQPARGEGAVKEGTQEGAWYWEPVRTLEAAERLEKSGDGNKPACFVAAKSGSSLYAARGWIQPAGSSPFCKPVMEPNPDYWDASLPRTTPQLLLIRPVSRCLNLTTNPPQLLPQTGNTPDGCRVHWPIWEQMDWNQLANLLAP